MFKNKRIVAMVLCALMLFVPVAAMAVDVVDYLNCFATAQEEEFEELSQKVEAYKTAVANAIKGEQGAKGALKNAVNDYENALKAAKEKLAAAKDLKAKVEKLGYETFTGEDFEDRTKEKAKELWEKGLEVYDQIMKDFAEIQEEYKAYEAFYKAAQETLKKLAAEEKAVNDLESAERHLDNVIDLYKEAKFKDIVKPLLVEAWNKYVSYASELQKISKFDEITVEEVIKEALGNVNTKRSMTAEGWTVFTKNDKDVFANVAEMKVTKEGKKTVIKLYGADKKEVKLNETLYIWMPIKKGTEVKNVKIDGGTVTFKVIKDGTIAEFSAEF